MSESADARQWEGEAPAEPQRPNSNLPYAIRKRPAINVFSSTGEPKIVFCTICTANRNRWLATSETHELLVDIWKTATAWLVGRYVILPDHIHLFAAPGDSELPLENWVRYWKSQFTKQHRQEGHKWQTGQWDSWLRSGDGYDSKWEYVRNNPVRHGLIDSADDWPFQGEIHSLDWW